jgi:hypothetical protein
MNSAEWSIRGYKLVDPTHVAVIKEYEDRKARRYASLTLVYTFSHMDQDFSSWFSLDHIEVEIRTEEGEARLRTGEIISTELLLKIYEIPEPDLEREINTKIHGELFSRLIEC